jgi:hypothetical protein
MSSLQKKSINPVADGKVKYADDRVFVSDGRAKGILPAVCEGKSSKDTSWCPITNIHDSMLADWFSQ